MVQHRTSVKDASKEVRKRYKPRRRGRKDHAGFEHHRSEVYFFECEHLIKIGKSYRAEKRLREIQRRGMVNLPDDIDVSKMKILAAVEGTLQDETRLHHRFKHLHVKGEWFQNVPELRDYALKVKETKNLFWEDDVDAGD